MKRFYEVIHDTAARASHQPHGVFHVGWNGRRLCGGFLTVGEALAVQDAWNADPEKLAELHNARLWVPLNDGWVKLTLEPGQEHRVYISGRDEEGSSYSGQTYRHEGAIVSNQWGYGGRDCDGVHHTAGEEVCPLDLLHTLHPGQPGAPCPGYGPGAGLRTPAWEDRRDYEERVELAYEEALR